jgi:hypothetical protein
MRWRKNWGWSRSCNASWSASLPARNGNHPNKKQMGKKIIYLCVAVALLAAGGLAGYYYAVGYYYAAGGSWQHVNDGSEVTYVDSSFLTVEDAPDPFDTVNAAGAETGAYDGAGYFDGMENLPVYQKYLTEMEQYKVYRTLDFLWGTTPAQTTDSISAAIEYFVSEEYPILTPLPDDRYFRDEDGQYEIAPPEIREFTLYGTGIPDSAPYAALVEFLRRGCRTIDYRELYAMYRPLVHLAVTQERYDTIYHIYMERLITAYLDFEDNPGLYAQVENFMNMYTESDTLGFSDHIAPWIMELLPESSVQAFTEEFDSGGRDVDGHTLVWAYSFWVRRRIEGNSETVYQTLHSIRRDYN